MKHKFFFLGAIACIAAAAMTNVVGCSDDEDSKSSGGDAGGAETSTPETSTSTTGTVVATVDFPGSATGQLTVAAIGPDGFAGSVQKNVTFPGAPVKLNPIENLPPGHYLIGANLDVGGNNPQEPGPEDPVNGVEIDLVAGQTANVNITLMLVPPDEDGGDGGDGGDAGSDAPEDG